jgi:colanic acid/amylovoran biosynthesis glycosyltransferase
MSDKFKVAYIMSRFPKLTETFILYEILAVQELGVTIELYPLMREHTQVMHAEAVPLVERAHFVPFISSSILTSNIRFMLKHPRRYFGTLWKGMRATWRSLNYFLGILAFFPKAVHMTRLMKQDGIQHIHAHFSNHPAAVAYMLHQLTGIPYSFTAHGADLHKIQHMLCEKTTDAAFVIAISSYNKDMIIEKCGEAMRDKVLIVHCGIDGKLFHPRTEEKPGDSFDILCIGSLQEVKGQTYLIEACRLLQNRRVDFMCHFAGDGKDMEKLQAQTSEAGLTDRIQFHGQVTRTQVLELLETADVVAMPSVPTREGKREGIPVALMEAMGSSIPVVASRLSGIPDLVDGEQNGILIEPRNSTEMADALERLYQDPTLRQRLGQAGREKVIREFELNTSAAELVRLFRSRGQ